MNQTSYVALRRNGVSNLFHLLLSVRAWTHDVPRNVPKASSIGTPVPNEICVQGMKEREARIAKTESRRFRAFFRSFFSLLFSFPSRAASIHYYPERCVEINTTLNIQWYRSHTFHDSVIGTDFCFLFPVASRLRYG